jgi:hypothetical protein
MRMRTLSVILITGVALAAAGTGCVQRQLTVTSTPPGALLYLNGVEVGRTPLTRDFTWYGVYDVELRKDGYQTLKTTGDVKAPWWQWVPLDFFAEFFPLTDRRSLSFAMTPQDPRAADPATLLRRAEQLGSELESSPYTRFRVTPGPATRATTRPATRPTTTTMTRPTTLPATTASSR